MGLITEGKDVLNISYDCKLVSNAFKVHVSSMGCCGKNMNSLNSKVIHKVKGIKLGKGFGIINSKSKSKVCVELFKCGFICMIPLL